MQVNFITSNLGDNLLTALCVARKCSIIANDSEIWVLDTNEQSLDWRRLDSNINSYVLYMYCILSIYFVFSTIEMNH